MTLSPRQPGSSATRLWRGVVVFALLTVFISGVGLQVLPSVQALAVVTTISLGANSEPYGISFHPGNNLAYVVTAGSGNVRVVDTTTDTQVGSPIAVGGQLNAIQVNPNTNHIFVGRGDVDSIAMIDASNGNTTSPISVESGPGTLGVNPATNKVYVANQLGHSVSVIDDSGSSPSAIATIATGGNPIGVGINSTTNRVYIGDSSGAGSALTVINGATDQVITSIPLPDGNAYAVAVNEVTNQIYVTHSSGTGISVFDGTSNSLVIHIDLGGPTAGLAINPTTNRIYVSRLDAGEVKLVDGATNSVIDTLAISGGPFYMARHPGTGKVYVTRLGAHAIDVLDGAEPGISGTPTAVPTATQTSAPTVSATATPTMELMATFTPSPTATLEPTATESPLPTMTPTATWTPGPRGSIAWTSAANMPRARRFFGSVELGGLIYAVGGDLNDTALVAADAYDPSGNTWATIGDLLTARRHHGVAALNGSLWVAGGIDTLGTHLDSVEEYAPFGGEWLSRTPLPSARTHLALAASGNKLYAIGGAQLSSPVLTDRNDSYDPNADAWTARAALPSPRGHMALVTWLDGTIYAIGGRNDTMELDLVDAYDPVMNTWSSRAPMPTARSYAGAALLGGRIYVVGGVSGNQFVTTVEIYDPATNTWEAGQSLLSARGGLGLAGLGAHLYAAGGSDGSALSIHEAGAVLLTITPTTTASPTVTPTLDATTAPTLTITATTTPGVTATSSATPTVTATFSAATSTSTVMATRTPTQTLAPTPTLVAGQTYLATSTILSPSQTEVLVTDTGPANAVITVPPGVANASLNFAGVMPAVSTAATLPGQAHINVQTSAGVVSLQIAPNTTISGPGWDGKLLLPQWRDLSALPPPPSGALPANLTGAIELGAPGKSLDYSRAIRLTFPGRAGQLVGIIANGQVTAIATVCSEDSQATGDALAAGGSCSIAAGPDQVVWTKHSSTYVTFANACTPRSTNLVQSVNVGGGNLQVTVRAQQASPGAPLSTLQKLELTQLSNAVVFAGGDSGRRDPFTLLITPPVATYTFMVRHDTPGATTVHFTITDSCGTWQTFVGGGAGAF